MNKGRVIGLLKQHSDVVLSFKDPKNNDLSHYLCTLEFKKKYIKSRTRGKNPWPKNKTDIVVFNWTQNKYWIFNPEFIIKMQPLSEILKNGKTKEKRIS